MEFIVRPSSTQADTVLVRYHCACGCKPNAEYRRGSSEVAYEHCCCGNVHFVGVSARAAMDAYLDRRAAAHEDDDVGGYTRFDTSLATPWGEPVSVAYALPSHPRQH